MAGERSGRGVAVLALVVSLIALGIAILAYREAGGSRVVQEQVRALQGALDVARRETAEALDRLERAIRPAEAPREAGGRPKR